MFEISDNAENTRTDGAKIKVIGVGGGGCNAVNTMIRAGLSGVEYVVANTDSQALIASLAPTKIQLGTDLTKGLGAGANPEVGRKAALDDYERLSEVIEGSDMVFITAGMGGGTGTGAAPVIAKLAKELGALTVGVVTKPFIFEGKKRFRQAEAGIQILEESVDSLITIPNQRLLYIAGENLSLVDTFKKADEVLLNAVRGISDLINHTGHINADFADVKTVMANKGLSLMGTGTCEGPDRAIKAATEAISSPLLEDITIDGATGIIINITGNESLTMHETNEAVTLIMEAADEDAEIIFGTVIDDSMGEAVKVTVIATGLGGMERVSVSSTPMARPVEAAPVRESVQAAPIVESAPVRHSQPMAEAANVEQVRVTRDEVRMEADEVAPELRAQTEVANNDSEQRTSNLINTIKQAASKYEGGRPEARNVAPAQGASAARNVNNNRAKTIAERLGFINFDEEELDTPSYLRKEEASEKEKQNGSSRPLEL
tara:strand:+ start:1242 stop:2711 length:1470 start_codon:yes stop_codon:yes gene_type:complete